VQQGHGRHGRGEARGIWRLQVLHKMTAAEIRAALAVEEEVKEVIDH
jgi:hypothetical protein